jgi:hypothetical protein
VVKSLGEISVGIKRLTLSREKAASLIKMMKKLELEPQTPEI